MATAADSAPNNHSPRPGGFSGDGLNSPQLRGRNTRNLSPPWSQVVRGGESDASPAAVTFPTATAPAEPSPDSDRSPPENTAAEVPGQSSDGGNNVARATKKPAWNKPSNGAVEVGPVMGADSWPALSESARASPKSSSDSLKALSDGSVTVQQGPVIASSPQKPLNNNNNNNANAYPNTTTNHAYPARLKPTRRGGGSANGEMAHDKPAAAVVPDFSPRDLPHKGNNWESGSRGTFASQPPHVGNDHPRNSYRRGNGGPHPRSDGPYHGNYGNRRDHDRGNYDWNPHRNFGSNRDLHMQQPRVVPRTFFRPPPTSAPFINPPPGRSFGNPIGFPDMTSPVYYVPAAPPESLRGLPGVPFVHPPPPAMYFPAQPDPQLRTMLLKQIDYYFSSENLCKDIFLRQNMDEQGWVPVSLIAGFNRVKQLTNNIQFILDTVRTSTIVEVQGDKLRKRNDWMNWLLPPPTASGPPSPAISNHDMLITRVQSMGLEDGPSNQNSTRGSIDVHTDGVLSRSLLGESSSQSPMPIGNFGGGGGQFSVTAGNDRSTTSRSLG